MANVSKWPPPNIEERLAELTFDPDEEIGVLSSPIIRLSNELAGDGQMSAPVRFPKKPELEVRLVNVSLLQRLDESRGDTALFQNVFFAILGVVFGLIPMIFEGGKINTANLVLLAIFGVLLSAVGLLCLRYGRRAQVLRNQIFAPESPLQ